MTEHTSGPWTFRPNAEIDAPDGLVASARLASRYASECEANARLIAAAPETAAERDQLKAENKALVALLKEARPHVEQMANALAVGPVVGPVERLADEITAAIAKATGEEVTA
jgi:hypothetical protein